MEKPRYKVGDWVIYVGCLDEFVGQIVKVLSVEFHPEPYYTIAMDGLTSCKETSLKHVSKLHKALE